MHNVLATSRLIDDRWSINETETPAIILFDGHPISQMRDTQFRKKCQARFGRGGFGQQELLDACWSQDKQKYDPSLVKDLMVWLLIENDVDICALDRDIRELDYDFADAAAMLAAGRVVNEAILSARQKAVVAA